MALSDNAGDLVSTSLAAAESILERAPAEDETPARLAAALLRLALSRRTGDLDAATAGAARAAALIEKIPASLLALHPQIRAQVLSGRGAAELRAGSLDDAVFTFRAGAAASADPDNAGERADCLGHLALVDALHGRLSRATEFAEGAAEAARNGTDGLTELVTPAASVALATVHLDRNEMQQAHSQLRLAESALQACPDRLISAVACLIAARRLLADGRAQAAAEIVGRARRGWSPPGWLEHRLMLLESRAYAAAGGIQAAVAAARRASSVSAAGAAVALARAWLADGDQQAARRALEAAATAAGAAPDQVRLDGWLVDARLSYGSGDDARGRRSLEHALRLGRPEQLRLPFALERTWIRKVMRRDPDLARAYADLLEPGLASPPAQQVTARPEPEGQAAPPLIIERLTERSIYRKLSAAHRNEAVRRARQLELI